MNNRSTYNIARIEIVDKGAKTMEWVHTTVWTGNKVHKHSVTANESHN